MMGNRNLLIKNLTFKDSRGSLSKVEFLFRRKVMKDGAHHFITSEWMEIENAFVVNHDFRSWRPYENMEELSGDRREGYSQLQISTIALEQFTAETGYTIDDDTKVRFQDQLYSVQGWDQFIQKDMIVYDLKRLYK